MFNAVSLDQWNDLDFLCRQHDKLHDKAGSQIPYHRSYYFLESRIICSACENFDNERRKHKKRIKKYLNTSSKTLLALVEAASASHARNFTKLIKDSIALNKNEIR